MKNPNLKWYSIVGGAAFFVALAGNANAIPLTMHDQWEAGISSWSSKYDQRDFASTFVFEQNDPVQRFAMLTEFSFLRSALAHNAFEPHHVGSWRSHHATAGVATTPALSTGQAGSPASVPDSGTTALMLAGALGGLVFVRRKVGR